VADTGGWKWHLDLVKISDNIQVITMVESFSRYMEAILVKDGTAEELKRALWSVFSRWPWPATLVMDNAKANLARPIASLLKDKNVTVVFISAYNARANGRIERMHQNVIAALKGCLKPEEAAVLLEKTLEANRQMVSTTTGSTPQEILFGMRGTELLMEAVAREERRAAHKNEKWAQNPAVKPIVDLKIGTKVMIHLPRNVTATNRKILPRWAGPFEVTNVGRFTVDISWEGQTKRISSHFVKIYHGRQPTFRSRERDGVEIQLTDDWSESGSQKLGTVLGGEGREMESTVPMEPGAPIEMHDEEEPAQLQHQQQQQQQQQPQLQHQGTEPNNTASRETIINPNELVWKPTFSRLLEPIDTTDPATRNEQIKKFQKHLKTINADGISVEFQKWIAQVKTDYKKHRSTAEGVQRKIRERYSDW